MDDHTCTAFCDRCQDFYYIRDSKGRRRLCPKCSCPRCQRLKNVHPDLGGCTCNAPVVNKLAPVPAILTFEGK